MVPGAIGSQTNGSVIRPAAFCGVVGFKPTHGLIPRSGALLLSRALDHVGVFARSVADAALLAEMLAGFDEEDPDTRADRASAVRRCGGKRAAAAAALRLRPLARLEAGRDGDAARRSPNWSRRWASRSSEVEIGQSFDRAIDMHRTVMEVEMAHNLHRDFEQGGEALSKVLRALIERGRKALAVDYTRALAGSAPLNQALDGVFDEYDAILTPAAPGPAPRGLDTTGNPVFCTLWTYLGTPAVTLPLLDRRERPADRRAAGRPPRQRCAALAHGQLAGQNSGTRQARRQARSRRARAKTRSGR